MDTSEMTFSSHYASSAYPFACVSPVTTTNQIYTMSNPSINNILSTLGNLDTMSLQYGYQSILDEQVPNPLTAFINEIFGNSNVKI
jgi:hypothetical protein